MRGKATGSNRKAAIAPKRLLKAPTANRTGEKLFDITYEEFQNACMGNPDAVQKLKDKGLSGEALMNNVPEALDAASKWIKGQADFHKAQSILVRLIQKHGGDVVGAVREATLAEKKLTNNFYEQKEQLQNDLTEEGVRHSQKTKLIQIDHDVALELLHIQYETQHTSKHAQIPTVENRRENAVQNAQVGLLWADGSNADFSKFSSKRRAGIGGIGKKVGTWIKRTLFGVGVATCNANRSDLQSRHLQTRIKCNYNCASARINCN
jgi:hypothetical protein